MAAGDVPTWLRRRTHQRVRTGSMYPTFPKGDGKDPKALSKQIVGTPGMFRYPNGIVLFGNRYFHHVLARGDIVVAENDVIRDISKTLRQVRRSSNASSPSPGIPSKSATASSSSTVNRKSPISPAGDRRLAAHLCPTVYHSPFLRTNILMGDNRKGSGDSRQDIGLVDEADIRWALPQKPN